MAPELPLPIMFSEFTQNHSSALSLLVLCLFIPIVSILTTLRGRSRPKHPFRPTYVLPIECWDLVLEKCTLRDIISFANTSQASRRYALSHISRRVHSYLSPWFTEPLAFRRQLKEHNAIVSGSFVLALAVAPTWSPRDLDIYVGSAGGLDALSQYLENEGFEDITPPPPLVDTALTPPYPDVAPYLPPNAQMSNYRRFVKLVAMNDRDTEVFVDLIQTRSVLPGNLVLNFPASCVINWLTANEIVLTYPRLTFNNVALLRPHGRKPPTGVLKIKEDIWLDKYVNRGFRLVEASTDALPQSCGESCPHLERNSRDTWSLRLHYGDEQWRGARQEDPTLTWPAPWYRPQVPVCHHPGCPNRTPVLPRLKYMIFLRSLPV
ncbi:hypothetical protein M407DRAFT_7842 [Tulasnella calospora MUT 4182]|uniref:F-box domain-containing protein n=1 Tax=Tulasnella calospora MUT 4182 TaxID=1051891 RepID=A0A0C3QI63_9AGAM|nr:hypothetical protein M407DRAFT_7842 [Tulasnella calospora MUT 4182]